jgi:hypothetical protein
MLNWRSRRNFIGASAASAAGGFAVLADPGTAAAQAVGVKKRDLPDLTIKEVRVYVTDMVDLGRYPSFERN